MATAIKKARSAGRPAHGTPDVPAPPPMEFLVFEDNGGSYHWRIVGDEGATLAGSGDFVSYDDAEHAAQVVRDGAASARLERRALGAQPVDLSARRDVSSNHSDAERWLDEGGSFSSKAVAKWPAQR